MCAGPSERKDVREARRRSLPRRRASRTNELAGRLVVGCCLMAATPLVALPRLSRAACPIGPYATRTMSKLVMYSLGATPGQLVATPVAVAAPPPAAGGAAASTPPPGSTGPRHSLAIVKLEDAGSSSSQPIASPARRVSPRKPRVAVKYEKADEPDDRQLPVGLARQSPARKRALAPGSPNAVASSSKPALAPPAARTKVESSPKKARRTPAAGADGKAFSLAPPPRWREAYDAIADMRRDIVAPVDSMGCAAVRTLGCRAICGHRC